MILMRMRLKVDSVVPAWHAKSALLGVVLAEYGKTIIAIR